MELLSCFRIFIGNGFKAAGQGPLCRRGDTMGLGVIQQEKNTKYTVYFTKNGAKVITVLL